MTHRRILITSIMTIGALALAPAIGSAAGQLAAVSDLGAFEHLYVSAGSVRPDTVQFVWLPEGSPGATAYGLVGSCEHFSTTSLRYVGNHKVTFKKVQMLGIDSGNTAKGANGKSKVKKGFPFQMAVWDLGSTGADFASSDSGILVTAQVKVSGGVSPGDSMYCYLGVVEGDASLFSAASTEHERQQIFEELAMARIRPRLAKPAE